VTAVASLARVRVRVVVDHTMPSPPDNKVKDLALIFWSVSSLPYQDFHLLSKTSWASVFLCVIFFTRIHLMKCLSSMVNLML